MPHRPPSSGCTVVARCSTAAIRVIWQQFSFEGVYHATQDSHIHRAQAAAVIYTVD